MSATSPLISQSLDSTLLISNDETANNPIKALPLDVGLMIFKMLEDADRIRASRVCRDWYTKVKKCSPLIGKIKVLMKSSQQFRKEEKCKPYKTQYPHLGYQIRQPLDIVFVEFPPSTSQWIASRQASLSKAKCFSEGIPSMHLEGKKEGDSVVLQLNNEIVNFEVIS